VRKCGRKGKKKEGVAEGNRCEVGEVEGYIQSGYGNIITPFGEGTGKVLPSPGSRKQWVLVARIGLGPGR